MLAVRYHFMYSNNIRHMIECS